MWDETVGLRSGCNTSLTFVCFLILISLLFCLCQYSFPFSTWLHGADHRLPRRLDVLYTSLCRPLKTLIRQFEWASSLVIGQMDMVSEWAYWKGPKTIIDVVDHQFEYKRMPLTHSGHKISWWEQRRNAFDEVKQVRNFVGRIWMCGSKKHNTFPKQTAVCSLWQDSLILLSFCYMT